MMIRKNYVDLFFYFSAWFVNAAQINLFINILIIIDILRSMKENTS